MSDVATSLNVSGGVLVGHDGSAASTQAVRWGAHLAHRIGCDLHVLRTWTISSATRPTTWSPGYVPPMTDFEQAVRERLQQDIDGLGVAADDLKVHCHVLHGSAGRRIVETSEKVELVVVAARGSGGFRGLLLGSTADQVVRHSHCPVVVLPSYTLELGGPADPDSELRGE